jgi:hypothetical protein
MKYMSGIEVMDGDVVAIRRTDQSTEGVVRKVILPNTPDARSWAAPNGGVLIEGGGLGLSVTESLENDEDVVFVRRASSETWSPR